MVVASLVTSANGLCISVMKYAMIIIAHFSTEMHKQLAPVISEAITTFKQFY